jgi:hypothetical protein
MLLALLVSACAMAPMPTPNQVVVPTPILNNTGKFMSPFTQDDVLAPWVDKAISVKAGAQVGAAVGSIAAQQAMSHVPFVGGILGDAAGSAAGRAIALSAIGGEEYIKSTSDISFNSLDDLAVYIYAKNSAHPAYADALDATMQIYPDLKQGYIAAIYKASNNGQSSGTMKQDAGLFKK